MHDFWLVENDTEEADSGGLESLDRRIEIRCQIFTWYEAGIPLFTRESIASFQQQLQHSQHGQSITYCGLDGKTVQSTVRTGNVIMRAIERSKEEIL